MDFLNLCRACLAPETLVKLLDWYQPIESLEYGLSYKECFCKCTQINLCLKDDPNETDETRTQYLCFDCAQKLKNAYDFIERAKRANKELCIKQIEKVKLDSIANNFEWVPVEVMELEMNTLPELTKKNSTECENHFGKKMDEHCTDGVRKVLADEKKHNSFARMKLKSLHKTKVKSKRNLPKKMSQRMDELVSCDVCNKTMSRKALRKHKPIHKPKGCIYGLVKGIHTLCHYSGLKNHELTHNEQRERYPCDKCNQTFLSPYSYKKHIETHENNRKPMYQCTQCDKSFLHKNGLTIHELHHKGATIECNICKKRYVRQIDLDTHLRTHSGESPFECQICGKSFIHKRILTRHMQYHEGFFSYTCLTCGTKFSKYDQYYAHRMQHTGLPYKCGSCEKQFPDAYKIKRHIKGVHKVEQDKDVEKLVVRINITKEHRGRIVEVLKNPEVDKKS